jgi:hypothetical protein
VEFNDVVLFGAGTALSFQIGIRGTVNDSLTMDTTGMNVDAATLLTTGVDLGVDAVTSKATLETIDDAINKVSGFRADLGAAAGRFIISATIAVGGELTTAELCGRGALADERARSMIASAWTRQDTWCSARSPFVQAPRRSAPARRARFRSQPTAAFVTSTSPARPRT